LAASFFPAPTFEPVCKKYAGNANFKYAGPNALPFHRTAGHGNIAEEVLLDIVLGVVGAVVAGFLFQTFGMAGVTGLNIYSIRFRRMSSAGGSLFIDIRSGVPFACI
jgi:uncharacterized membrane protein YeaQ/YmgE (transglycosylase-associated protein family)